MICNRFDASNPDHVHKFLGDGSTEQGKFLLCEDGLPRFFTHQEIQKMRGVGEYSGSFGYCEYEKENIQ